jgi:hypothetical protein
LANKKRRVGVKSMTKKPIWGLPVVTKTSLKNIAPIDKKNKIRGKDITRFYKKIGKIHIMDSLKLKITIVLSIILLVVIDTYIFWRYIKIPLFCSKNTITNIVAHEDDDLLFLSPDLIHDIDNGRCIKTIFITAGDAGSGSSYWLTRENGSKAAYASMSNADNIWIENQIVIENNKISIFNLKNNPKISLIFLRLPDGNFKGTGYNSHDYQSISKLWQNKTISINTVDNSAIYTKKSLINVLLELIKISSPIEIHTQDFIGNFGDGDHSDHYAAAYFAYEAEKKYTKPHTIISYMDYLVSSRPNNISSEDLLKKQNAFFVYGKYDNQALQQNYIPWITRQYKIFIKNIK